MIKCLVCPKHTYGFSIYTNILTCTFKKPKLENIWHLYTFQPLCYCYIRLITGVCGNYVYRLVKPTNMHCCIWNIIFSGTHSASYSVCIISHTLLISQRGRQNLSSCLRGVYEHAREEQLCSSGDGHNGGSRVFSRCWLAEGKKTC